ncbi:esterase-like activity of phytase family protein [Mycobacterium decipiens]|uniref:Phytase n=1 Tax=Mycobacterium decipiens TaxID=1430326 RepID=A0A1X2LPZ4_9MYCO|nr:esterase-like activity of phytase family protein [Mycobacterium decipiens]OSC38153.1 phytase [Mycobacterium decipiens]
MPQPKTLVTVAVLAWVSILCPTLCLAGCAPAQPPRPANAPRPLLNYLGQTQIPSGATFHGTVIGGLSGISYDPDGQLYYAISDDRSQDHPARFYTMRILLSDKGISDVVVTGVHPLQPPHSSLPVVSPDPEGIAFDAARHRLYWCSEGERRTDRAVHADPWIRIAAPDGGYLGQFTLPPNLRMSAPDIGPRHNRALEGLALTPDGRSLYAAMEDPGYGDEPPNSDDHQVLTRFTKFDVETTAPIAQYAYPMEPAARSGVRNGVSDLVALSDTTFLVVERSTAIPPVIRIFRAEIGAATDVLATPSLQGAVLTPMSKSLAVDLSALSVAPDNPVGNIEGITLGPKLPDGRQSVVLVSDNDFLPILVTQFLLFAL